MTSSHPGPTGPLVSVRGLSVVVPTSDGVVRAVDDVSFEVGRGKAFRYALDTGLRRAFGMMLPAKGVPVAGS